MSLKRTFSTAFSVCALLLSALPQDQGRRIELEESLQSRYRLTVLGGGFMGTRGENNIRKAGGLVVLAQKGLYGSFDRGRLASNGIRDGKTEVFSGDKDVALAPGEKFYVTAVHVGSDVVTIGLLSPRMIPGATKTSQVWCTANFFFTKETLSQGDVAKVYSVIDQWILPEGTISAPAPAMASTATPPAPAAPALKAVDLKPGMTRDDVVNTLGAPIQEVEFGDRRWLTYAAVSVTLEQGKLTAVDRNAQALVPVKISSDPDGADVSLDGSFVSSTPAVLSLREGTYKVVVKMSGYADWVREVKILPGAEVRLDAKLTR